MIFQLGKKRMYQACLRNMGPVFWCRGLSSSCCLLPLPPGFCSPEDVSVPPYSEGELQRQFKLFSRFLTLFLLLMSFLLLPCTGEGQTRPRPLPCTDEPPLEKGCRSLMVAVPGEQGCGSVALPGDWHIILPPHQPQGAAPSLPPLAQVPQLTGKLQLCWAYLGIWSIFWGGQCGIWAAASMGTTKTQPSLFLVEVFV